MNPQKLAMLPKDQRGAAEVERVSAFPKTGNSCLIFVNCSMIK